MFAKKKIVLNSAINDNKKGVALITCLDSLTNLQIKINNFSHKSHSNYVFLLKNNGIQQRFLVDDPRNFECEVDIPIDLDKKISCLLIENGTQPIFWGGTQTQTQTINSFDTLQENENTSKQAPSLQQNSDKLNNINTIYTTTKQNSDFTQSTNNSFDNKIAPNENSDINNDYAYVPQTDEKINTSTQEHTNNNLQLHKSDPQEALFTENDSDIEKEIDNAMQYELIDDCEPNSPQCAHCKYKEIFFREKQIEQAKEQLQKITELQKAEQSQNEAHEYSYTPNSQESTFTNAKTHDNVNQENNYNFTNSNTFIHTYSQEENNETIDNDNSESHEKTETDNQEANEKEKNGADSTPYYYGLIKSQYEEMFQKYPAFERLSTIIDNSKWIMVDSEEPYIMGIIYEGNTPQYLCYGVIQEKKHSPPIEIIDSSQWVPFDVNNEFGAGAYIMYQSAESGETLKVEVC